jgi:hypothetical protein
LVCKAQAGFAAREILPITSPQLHNLVAARVYHRNRAMGKTRGHGTRKGGASSGRARGGRGKRPATEAAASDYSGSESEDEKVAKVKVKRDGEV